MYTKGKKALLFGLMLSMFMLSIIANVNASGPQKELVIPTFTPSPAPDTIHHYQCVEEAQLLFTQGIDTSEELGSCNATGVTQQVLTVLVKQREEAQAKAAAEKLAAEARSINAYLAGSPLAGKGEVFILAAREYGIDPRIGPAIALKESSLGRHCFRSYNAWGMMGHSFSSWDEGIYANAKLISRLGGSITPRLAAKYCPPTASAWYSFIKSQMSKM